MRLRAAGTRRERAAELNANPERAKLEAKYGRVWTTDELTADFEIKGPVTPYIVVKRKRDGQVGSLESTRDKRFYYNFVADFVTELK